MREGIALYGGMLLGVAFVGLFGFKGFSQLFSTSTPQGKSQQQHQQ